LYIGQKVLSIWFFKTVEIKKARAASSSKTWPVGSLRAVMVPLVVFAALWCLPIVELSQYWATVPEYSFGWVVPVCSAYLFLIRWKSRPAADVPRSPAARWVFWIAGFSLLPTWAMGQANPDWRLIAWGLAVEAVALSLSTIYLVGGRSWLKQFGFCACLILAAVPLPGDVEGPLIQGLTQASTMVTVAALNLFQINALQHGNLVELKTGFVGIDGACSGIRSLQAALMMSLFLGELHRTSLRRRCWLIVCAVVIAFSCNSVRILLLTAITSKQGVEAMANWHDLLGYASVIACFLSIWGIARVISGPMPALPPATGTAPVSYPHRLVLCLGAWILFTVLFTEIWYRSHEIMGGDRWSFAWPVQKSDFADIPVSKFEADALLFDEGRKAEWANEDGSHWVAYFFRWRPGPSRSRILARMHRPENCFQGAGYKPCADHGMIIVQVKGLSLPFHALDFEDNNDKKYVFFCLWEDGVKTSERPRIDDHWSRLAKLRSVLLGQRNLGQQTLEVVITGYDNPKQAEAAFRSEIVRLIEKEPNKLIVSNR
jgi:exosortase